MAKTMYRATVYDPEGKVMQRLFKGKAVGEVVVDRDDAHRAWLTARAIPDEPDEWPPGVTIKVEAHRKRKFALKDRPPTLVLHRGWDGEKWVETETGEPVV